MQIIRDRRRHGAYRSKLRNERGAVLVLMAFALVVFLGIAALAIDLGLLFVAKSEAQRAADAAAHAGAGFYQLDRDETSVRNAVVEFGRNNSIRGAAVELDPDDIVFEASQSLVRVTVRRTEGSPGGSVPTLFARALGISEVGVTASAAAQLYEASAANCLLPIAIPQRFVRRLDGSRPEEDEAFDDIQHVIVNYEVGDTLVFREDADTDRIFPAWWGTVFSEDNPVFAGRGTSALRDAIASCSPAVFERGDDLTFTAELDQARGNRNNLHRPFETLIGLDAASWDPIQRCVVSTGNQSCQQTPSPRIRPLFLFDPSLDLSPGGGNQNQQIPVADIVPVFIERVTRSQGNYEVTVIIVPGSGLGPTDVIAGPGSTLTGIRIVE